MNAQRPLVLYRRAMKSEADLLRCLTDCDADSVSEVLAFPAWAPARGRLNNTLTPKAKMLVRLAALVALDASTTSFRWAVEGACAAGAADDEIVAVLMSVGADVGAPRLVSSAPRLALAIGYDIEFEGWDGERS